MKRRTFLIGLSASAACAALSSHRAIASSNDVVDIIFDEAERVIIEEYFGLQTNGNGGSGNGKNKSLPPGLTKRDQLPPGLAKQIQRNGTLPPGLATRALPSDLIYSLPPRHDGTERVIVGNDVVLIRAGTRYILDVIKDVVTQ